MSHNTRQPDLEKLFAHVPMEDGRPVMVAVSGGGDSLALLCLAHAWATGQGIELLSVTVDHGLRPEASQEAVFAASVARGLGVHHETIAWADPKPSSGLAMAARQARYRLLSQYARHQGARVILVGHTAEDQAETVLMRAFRDWDGSPGRGLAGMSERVKLDRDMLICRPLLGMRRQVLRAYLAGLNQSWIEDPTNRDKAYERVQVREILSTDPVLHGRLLRFSAVMGRFRGQLSQEVAILGRNLVTFEPGPVAKIDLAGFNAAPRPVRYLLLQVVLTALGGGKHLVSGRKFEGFLDGKSKLLRSTAGRCVLDRDGTALRIWRENRDVATIEVTNQHTTIWDDRFELRNNTGYSLCVGPPDEGVIAQWVADHKDIEADMRTGRRALGSTLCIRMDGRRAVLPLMAGTPILKGLEIRLKAPAIRDFLANSDLPLEALIGEFETSLQSL